MKNVLFEMLIILTVGCQMKAEKVVAFVFSTFTGNGEGGLHLMVNIDGYVWGLCEYRMKKFHR